MREHPLLRALAAISLALTIAPRAAAAKWTEIIVTIGTYADQRSNLEATGASDEVDILVWHNTVDWMTGEITGLTIYSLLKDTNPANPPGECCPSGLPPCCGSVDIPPADLGVTSIDFSKANLDKLLAYARVNFPSEHVVLVMRGVPWTNSELLVWDFDLMDLADSLALFNSARGDRKVDVLALSFCLSSSTDWSYAFAPVVDYYVGPPNFTNPPVTARWRVHRWARELARHPEYTGRDLAAVIVDLFTETTQMCIDQGDNCSNLIYGEPWTVGASDLSQSRELASGVRAFVCAYLPRFDAATFYEAQSLTTRYGFTPAMPLENLRYDLKHFGMVLKTLDTDPALGAAIDKMIAALDRYVFASAVEPTGFDDQSYGLSAFFNNGYSVPEKIGPFMYDSLWKALLRKAESGTDLPEPTGVAIDAATTVLAVGQDLTLTAYGTSPTYGLMCPVPAVRWQVSAPAVASLATTDTNPTVLHAAGAGTVRVTATAGGTSATIDVVVSAAADAGVGGPDAGTGGDDVGGCGCRTRGGSSTAGLLAVGVVLLLLSRRRLRSRRRGR